MPQDKQLRSIKLKDVLEKLDLIQTVNTACDTVAPMHPSYRPVPS